MAYVSLNVKKYDGSWQIDKFHIETWINFLLLSNEGNSFFKFGKLGRPNLRCQNVILFSTEREKALLLCKHDSYA